MKTKHAINIKPQIRRKAERLSIQEDKDTADHISRNVAYGQFARRFSYTAERRVPIRGAFLGAGRWSNMDQMTENFAKFYLRKTLSCPSCLSQDSRQR